MASKLLIVESPAKAKTIEKYLGANYKVISSYGHVRGIVSENGAIDTENNFEIKYQNTATSQKHIKNIVDLSKKADEIYLATDLDREGEAISWHIYEILREKNVIQAINFEDSSGEHSKGNKDSVKNEKKNHNNRKDSRASNKKIKRITFHEITAKVLREAVENSRAINMNLVRAQQSRQALDYLVGFTISPILWKKLPGSKSAGRVQSVALRMICEREEEIEKFKSQEYWTIEGNFCTQSEEDNQNTNNTNNNNIIDGQHSENHQKIQQSIKNKKQNLKQNFTATLTQINHEKLGKFSIKTEKEAQDIIKFLRSHSYKIEKIEKKKIKKLPAPPFTTSTMIQEAAHKLYFSAKFTSQIAQKLYEGIEIGSSGPIGLITYMRTDSTHISSEATENANRVIRERFGPEYALPIGKARQYKNKVKNAQEAHEAIRPTNISLIPEQIKQYLTAEQYKLYDLIWKRTIASQMKEALLDSTSVTIAGSNITGNDIAGNDIGVSNDYAAEDDKGSMNSNVKNTDLAGNNNFNFQFESSSYSQALTQSADLDTVEKLQNQQDKQNQENLKGNIVDQCYSSTFYATGSIVSFPGFYILYQENNDDNPEDDVQENKEPSSALRNISLENKANLLPALIQNQPLKLNKLNQKQHFTQAPPRYNEASLVKQMEKLGIGRPSTYANIISILKKREYVELLNKRFQPSDRGRLVTAFLLNFFTSYVEYNFTANLEEELDYISNGKRNYIIFLKDFWKFFKEKADAVSQLQTSNILEKIEETMLDYVYGDNEELKTKKCPSCDNGKLQLKSSKFGTFIACSNYPECRFTHQTAGNIKNTAMSSADNQAGSSKGNRAINTKDVTAAVGEINQGSKILGKDPQDGVEITLNKGPYGYYVMKDMSQTQLHDEYNHDQLSQQHTFNNQDNWQEDQNQKYQNLQIDKQDLQIKKITDIKKHKEDYIEGEGQKKENNTKINDAQVNNDAQVKTKTKTNKTKTTRERKAVVKKKKMVGIPKHLSPQDVSLDYALKLISLPLILGKHPEDGLDIKINTGRFGPYVEHNKIFASIKLKDDRDFMDIHYEEALAILAAKKIRGSKVKAGARIWKKKKK